MIRFFFSCFYCFLALSICAQSSNLGLASIRNFAKDTYRGGLQSWDFAQDSHGRLFVANNEGLLVFDGINWRKHTLPKQTILRSIHLLPDGRILAGGESELGYFQGDSMGRLQFHSLISQLPDSLQNFTDVWSIDTLEGLTYLRTRHLLMRYDGQKLTPLQAFPDTELQFSSQVQGKLWLQTPAHGLCYWQDGQLTSVWQDFPWGEHLIVNMLPWQGESILIATLKSGLWIMDENGVRPWQTSHDPLIRSWRLHTMCRLDEKRLALATTRGGLLILNQSGQVIQHLDQQRGLQDNSILALSKDRNGNLWLGLNYGIDFVELNSATSIIYPDAPIRGTAYAACFFEDYLYLGTSSGLYALPWQAYHDPTHTSPWTLVPGTQGQVWNLTVIGDQLLMGHHEGAFLIRDGQARHVPGTQGVWTFLKPPSQPNLILAGTYQGLIGLAKTDQGLQLSHRLTGFQESSRFLVQDRTGVLWMSHPYRGVFRLQLDSSAHHITPIRYGQAHGLPADILNHVFDLQGHAVVAGQRGVYTFDPQAERFIPHPDFQARLPQDERIIRLQEDSAGNVWYVTDQEVGVWWIKDQGLSKEIERQSIPALADRLVGGYELVYPMDQHHVWFGLEKGFMRYNSQYETPEEFPWEAVLSRVVSSGSEPEILYGGFQSSAETRLYPNDLPGLRFECGATQFAGSIDLRFRYRLKGLSSTWSAWTDHSIKEYTNLFAGAYQFEVQAQDVGGRLSQIGSFAFEIEPAWYQSWAAILAYAMLGLTLITGLIWVPRLRYEREKAELEQVHQEKQAVQQQRIVQTEAQVEALTQEKLAAEVSHKSQELATATMHLVQKNEVISHLRQELTLLLEQHPQHPGNPTIDNLIRMLGHDQQFDQDWEQFAFHFDQVHAGFLRRLAECFPQLTPKDQRLCAYLRMNLSTKEIAPLMNISVRGVEISRYRLRKKLELDRSVNLNEFMMSF